MPRFHLHIFNGQAWIQDLEGSELADLDAARSEAASAARQMWAAAIAASRDLEGYRFEIESDALPARSDLAFDDVLPERLVLALRRA